MSIYDNKVYKGGHHAGLRAAAAPFRRDWHRAQVIAQIDPKNAPLWAWPSNSLPPRQQIVVQRSDGLLADCATGVQPFALVAAAVASVLVQLCGVSRCAQPLA
jgi:hypothetical protein